jgi:hypothetical protein
MQLCDLRVYTARRKEEKKLAKKGSRRGQFRAKKGSVPSI